MKKITIVVPVFKVRQYIERCVDGIAAQACDGAELECIFVDDGSPDDSAELLARKLEAYDGPVDFKVEHHSQNRGLSAARNTGLRAATGDYVLFVDSDDQLLPGTVTYFLESLEGLAEPEQVDFVMGNCYVCKDGKPAMQLEGEAPLLIDNSDEAGLRLLLTRDLFHTAWNKLARRDFLLSHQLFFEDGIIDEDFLWSYQLFLNAQQMLILPRITYIYEDNPGSIMNTSSEKMAFVIESRIVACTKILATPTRCSQLEFFMYVFYILTRAVNLYEKCRRKDKASVKALGERLYALRDGFLQTVWQKGYRLAYAFFLTSVKPFYYITYLPWFRRYYDKIAKKVVSMSGTHVKTA